ncbi:MAG: hypothetical protein WAV38_34090 [Xanthobacteraceae bacterium]
MSDWRKFESLFYGPVPVCILNEPIEPITALDVARHRWRTAELVSGDKDERQRI